MAGVHAAEISDDDTSNVLTGEEGAGADEVYIVEKILDHMFIDKILHLEVKWKGYNKKSDNTWEPEENCEGAEEILAEYYDSIGGRPEYVDPEAVGKLKTKKRKSINESASAKKKKRATSNGVYDDFYDDNQDAFADNDFKLPEGSWENEIQVVDTVERGPKGLQVYLQWNDGRKTIHDIETVYQKCPQRMLHFYEQHLIFKDSGES